LLERDQGGDDSELAFEQTSCWTWPVRGSERSGCGAMGKEWVGEAWSAALTRWNDGRERETCNGFGGRGDAPSAVGVGVGW